jgi:hypothetical protein
MVCGAPDRIHKVQRWKSGCYPFYENVVFIEAESSQEAWQKAEQFGKENEFDDPSFTRDDRPAHMVFAVVRKIIAPAGLEEPEASPTHGTELTYSFMVIDKEEDFLSLVNNELATVHYEE